jgi:hypothetical protein
MYTSVLLPTSPWRRAVRTLPPRMVGRISPSIVPVVVRIQAVRFNHKSSRTLDRAWRPLQC